MRHSRTLAVLDQLNGSPLTARRRRRRSAMMDEQPGEARSAPDLESESRSDTCPIAPNCRVLRYLLEFSKSATDCSTIVFTSTVRISRCRFIRARPGGGGGGGGAGGGGGGGTPGGGGGRGPPKGSSPSTARSIRCYSPSPTSLLLFIPILFGCCALRLRAAAAARHTTEYVRIASQNELIAGHYPLSRGRGSDSRGATRPSTAVNPLP